eukprot:3468322-Pyramimonas_sp.AAC.1
MQVPRSAGPVAISRLKFMIVDVHDVEGVACVRVADDQLLNAPRGQRGMAESWKLVRSEELQLHG